MDEMLIMEKDKAYNEGVRYGYNICLRENQKPRTKREDILHFCRNNYIIVCENCKLYSYCSKYDKSKIYDWSPEVVHEAWSKLKCSEQKKELTNGLDILREETEFVKFLFGNEKVDFMKFDNEQILYKYKKWKKEE